jgi:hypothetical protein
MPYRYSQYTHQVYSARAEHVDSAGQRIWAVVLKASQALVSALGIRESQDFKYWNRTSHYSRADGDGTTGSDTYIRYLYFYRYRYPYPEVETGIISDFGHQMGKSVGIKHVSDCIPIIIVPKIFLQEKAAETTK